MAFTSLLALALCLCLSGCGGSEPPPRDTITYTFDAQTRELIDRLAKKSQRPVYLEFDRYFKGVFVPQSLLPLEPFVLGLSTESRIPTVLILDAPWVQRYGLAGWLYELERTGVFAREELVPAVAEAFSLSLTRIIGRPRKELMAVPTSIKGNILFYRRDLLERHQLAPPRTWEELKTICRKVLPQEKSLKYGLLVHPTNFINDFYPIFWGFGGQVLDGEGRLALSQDKNLSAWVGALTEVVSMQGSIIPGPKELPRFEEPTALRKAFYRGEALFMINWNTRLQDLKGMIQKGEGKTPAGLTRITQVGVAPIPCRRGQKQRYSNIGSFGWGVNRFAVISPRVIDNAKKFINLVTDEPSQILAAETLGQVPALKEALKKVTNPEVLQVYQETFASPDMVLQPRPFSRRINNVLERYLQEALYARQPPGAATQAALKELQETDTTE
ncbi:MAG: extracellular solute-binding protein [Thermodesulfobacteriota bacterium]